MSQEDNSNGELKQSRDQQDQQDQQDKINLPEQKIEFNTVQEKPDVEKPDVEKPEATDLELEVPEDLEDLEEIPGEPLGGSLGEPFYEQPDGIPAEPPRPDSQLAPIKPARLASLDALRGFDMFWIIGGAELAHAVSKLTDNSIVNWLSGQMEHVEWNGFQAMDLIFPLFLFISGVTMSFSLRPRLEQGGCSFKIYFRVILRGLLLVLLGCIFNGLLKFDWENMRYPSVLGRIGLAWMFAALIFIHTYTDFRKLIISIAVILLGYWGILKLIPVPGTEAGDLTMEGSLVGYIDKMLIPGKLYKDVHDPEGLLSTFPAIATALMGTVTGELLRTTRFRNITKVPIMLAAGGVCIGLGYLWSFAFPINKNLWSSSFVLYAGGWSLLLLAIFYFLIDICRLKPLAFFFIVMGMNSITIYMCAHGLIDFEHTGHYLIDGALKLLEKEVGDVVWFSVILLLEWIFLFYIYRKKLFLRL